MSATGIVRIRNAAADPDEGLYAARQLAALSKAISVHWFQGDTLTTPPDEDSSSDFPFWGYVYSTDANLKTANRYGSDLKKKWVPGELDGDGKHTAAKDREYKRRMLFGDSADERKTVAAASLTASSASSSHYVKGRVTLYPKVSEGGDRSWGAETPYAYVGAHCSQTTAVGTTTKTVLSDANRALFPDEFDTMFANARHNGAWWKANAKYSTVAISQNATAANIYYLVIFGMSYVAVPDSRLSFADATHSDILAKWMTDNAFRTAAQVKSDLGIDPSGFPATMYGTFVEHGAKSFALRLQYSNFGVTALNEYNVGSGDYVGSTPAYLKNRWDNYEGSDTSGTGICALWKRKYAGWLTAIYTAATTSSAAFRIISAGNGKVSFGASSESTSIFFENPLRWSSGNGGQRRVYVSDGSLCHMVAEDGDSGTDRFFKCWVSPKSGTFVSGSKEASVAHGTEGGVYDAVAVFTSLEKNASRTLVVVAGGYNGDTLGPAVSAKYRDFIATYMADGSSAGGGEAKVQPQSRCVTAWTFDADETKFMLATTGNEDVPRILRRLVVDGADQGLAKTIEVSAGKTEFNLPQVANTTVVLAEFGAPEAYSVTCAGATRIVAQNGRSGAKFYEGTVEIYFDTPIGQRLSLSQTVVKRYVESGGQTVEVDVSDSCGLRVTQGGFAFEMRDGDHVVTIGFKDIDYVQTISFSDASEGHGASGEALIVATVNGVQVEGSAAAGGEPLQFNAHYGDTIGLTVGNVERASAVALAEGGEHRIEFTEAETTAPDPRQFSATYAATGTEHIRVFLGAEVSVSVAVPGVDHPGEGSTGTVSISCETATRVSSAVAPYGTFATIKATENPSVQYGKLLCVTKGEGNADRRDAIFDTGPVATLGWTFTVTGDTAGAYTAVFGPASSLVFLKIANADGQNYGKVGLWDGGAGSGWTKYESEAAFLAALAQGSGLPEPETETRGGALRSVAASDSFVPPTTGPEFWSFRPGFGTAAGCDPLEGLGYDFLNFTFEPFVDTSGATSGDSVEVSRSRRFPFAARASGVITVNYNQPGRREVAAYGSAPGGAVSAEGDAEQAESGTDEAGRSYARGYFKEGGVATLRALASSGHAFAGWYSSPPGDRHEGDLVSESSSFEVEIAPGVGTSYSFWADFEPSDWSPLVWEGGSENMEIVWRSRRFEAGQPLELTSARVEADGYPVDLKVRYASSPEAGAGAWREASITVESQDSRRLPMGRPERFTEVEVRATAPVLKVAVSSSMAGLVG